MRPAILHERNGTAKKPGRKTRWRWLPAAPGGDPRRSGVPASPLALMVANSRRPVPALAIATGPDGGDHAPVPAIANFSAPDEIRRRSVPALATPLGLAGDREPLSGRARRWQEGRRPGRPAPVTLPARRGRARDRPQRHSPAVEAMDQITCRCVTTATATLTALWYAIAATDDAR